jgi:hypothetical protein
MRNRARTLWRHLLRSQRGGVAMVLLLSFMAFAVPVATASVQFAGQLARNAQVFDDRLFGGDAARAGVEAALYELRTNPDPADALVLAVNGIAVNVSLVEGTTTADLSDFAYADVALSLDVSGSVSSSELVQLKEAANAIVDAFDLYNTSTRIRIGVVRFRGTAEGVVAMTNEDAEQTDPTSLHFSGVGLHEGINGLVRGGPGLGSGTNLVAAITGGAAQFSTGLGDRAEVPNLLVVITDGNDTNGNSDTDIENASLASGAEVFAVGVGTGIDTSSLNAMATDPDASHVFTTSNYGDLLALVESIVQAVNDSALIGTLYDIESVASDGSTIWVRVLLTPGGDVVILSWTEG